MRCHWLLGARKMEGTVNQTLSFVHTYLHFNAVCNRFRINILQNKKTSKTFKLGNITFFSSN